jgi:uncharacterized repeat protein (TIGR01451 family)
VTVTDTLPAGVTFVSATSSQGTCTNASGTVTCTVGNLANGASATITINVTTSVTPGSITNTATVTGNEPDPNTANNRASAVTQVNGTGTADMSITKTAPTTVNTSSPMVYTIVATNNGPSPATGVTVTDTLPSGVTFVSATSSQGSCTNSAGTVTCTVGNLASGASATISINATSPSHTGTITNTAKVSATQPDPNTANNTASATTQVKANTAMADLNITKYGFDDEGDQNTPTVGDRFYYVLVVHNAGPSQATGVMTRDTLPAGMSFNWARTTQGSCSFASGTVTCNLGTLAANPNKPIFVVISVTPTQTGAVSNTAIVSGNESDPNPANNSSTLVTTVSSTDKDNDD